MRDKHGGNIKRLSELAGLPQKDILDFSASINPLGPPEWLRPLISSRISSLVHYPDPECSSLMAAISASYGVTTEEVIVGNGSTELLHLLPRVIQATRAVIPVPAYSDYATAAELAGLAVNKVILKEEEGFRLDLSFLESEFHGHELVFLGHPNNPTGLLCDSHALRTLAGPCASTIFVVDEAFADFVEGMDSLITNRPPNVVVIRSFTKFFAIPGLRLGCAIARPEIIGQMRRMLPPWSVNSLAQAVGEEALRDREYAGKSRIFVREQRECLSAELTAIPGLTFYHGQANFLLVRIDRSGLDAPTLAVRLLRDGIAIRVCTNFDGLDSRFFRVAVRNAEENGRFCQSLRSALGISQPSRKRIKTPAIMFQGTGSNAGKSILAAALCRILLQDGYRVVPFKAQNMSLNSYVTRTGGEMGRAQVVQAQASKLDPDVRMNPILLKPNSDTGSQVIVLGQPVGNMDVGKYIEYKPRAFEMAREAFDSLVGEYEVVVLEGAGSPSEVNLKHHDIVNMGMARHAQAPVLLVGDIDRGGVFASFIGTMEVLAEWERALITGFIINRFRGNEALLRAAIDYTQSHTGLPTLGVVPYLQNLGLPEEDSVTFKSSATADGHLSEDRVEIAVIDLPHISNFTDFDPLRIEKDVYVRIVRTPLDLHNPDAVILPGSKNVIDDLEYLRKTGLARQIVDMANSRRIELIGICGGFQFLGQEISDPYGIESSGQRLEGLGLLPLTTVLAREKTLKCVTAKHLDSGLTIKGYEIHHGKTESKNLLPFVIREDGEIIGVKSPDGLWWGTYLHGIFDADAFRRWFIDRLRQRRGLSPIGYVCATYDLEPAFDRLAQAVRSSLRMEEIYRIMGLRRK